MDESDILISTARSNDPVQQHLRDQKKIWNASARELIANLIAFKRGLNGKGDPRVGIPASNIKDPLPSEIGTYLNHIADNYLSVVKGAEQIIQEQERYSQTRRKPQSIIPGQPMSADDGLVTEASWWGSRLWAKTFGLRGSDREELSRILDAVVDLRKQLYETENAISSSDPNGIADAFYVAIKFGLGSYNSIVRNLDKILTRHNKKLESAPEKSTDVSVPTTLSGPNDNTTNVTNDNVTIDWEAIDLIRKDSEAMMAVLNLLVKSKLLDNSQILPLVQKMAVFKIMSHKKNWPSYPPNKIKEVVRYYNDTVDSYQLLKGMAQSALQTQAPTFKDMILSAKNTIDDGNVEDGAIKTAHNALTRYLKRKWLERPFFRNESMDSAKTLAIESILQAVKTLSSFLDMIEKGTSIDDLFVGVQNISEQMAKVYEGLLILADLHNNEYEHNLQRKDKTSPLHHIKNSQIQHLRRWISNMRLLNNQIIT